MKSLLVQRAEEELSEIPGFKRIGTAKETANILSFIVEGLHSSDLSFVMTKEKVALRAGHHCCMPLMDKLGLSSGTMRASFSIYNREEDVVMLKRALTESGFLLKSFLKEADLNSCLDNSKKIILITEMRNPIHLIETLK